MASFRRILEGDALAEIEKRVPQADPFVKGRVRSTGLVRHQDRYDESDLLDVHAGTVELLVPIPSPITTDDRKHRVELRRGHADLRSRLNGLFPGNPGGAVVTLSQVDHFGERVSLGGIDKTGVVIIRHFSQFHRQSRHGGNVSCLDAK